MGPTDQEMLYKLHESSGFSDDSWLTREKILDLLQKDGGEIIAATTLHNEIQVLLKRQLIAERKVPGKKNKSAYAATQVIEGQSLFATKPSDIVDSTFNKSEVEVIDILERTMVQI